VIGQVSRIFPGKGYGFIKTEEGDEFFFHMSALKGVEWAALTELCDNKEGPLVYFKEMKHNRGPRAISVELIPNA
jgi:cold shock CspA family protein